MSTSEKCGPVKELREILPKTFCVASPLKMPGCWKQGLWKEVQEWLKLLFSTCPSKTEPPVPLAASAAPALPFVAVIGSPERQYAFEPPVHPAATTFTIRLLKRWGSA